MGITIFRHGETEYNQPYHTTLEDAWDLTSEGIENVTSSAHRFVTETPLRDVIMYTSPMGRTIHTAQIIRNILEGSGVYVEDLLLDERLTEVKEFHWPLFEPLVIGGKVAYEGNQFDVDAAKTNPEGLSAATYFFRDLCHKIRGLPEWYAQAIGYFERCSSVNNRIKSFLNDAIDMENVIAVTHEALFYDIMDRFTNGREQGIDRSHYVHLVERDNGLYVAHTTTLDEGNSEVNVLG